MIDYKIYHYNDENINDIGWGCTYRNIQTILSCYKKYYDSSIIIPKITEIVYFFEKNIKIIKNEMTHSSVKDLWIEPYHVGVFLKWFNIQFDGKNYLYVLNDKDIAKILKTDILIYLNENSIINNFEKIQILIEEHFSYTKLPIVIDDGTYSYCIVLNNSDRTLFLIDPHKTNDDNISIISFDFLKKRFWMFFFPHIQL